MTGCGQHLFGLEHRPNAALQTQTLQARCSQNNAVIQAVIELFQAGIQVATQGLVAQIGTQRLQQGHAAQARGSHYASHGQILQRGIATRDPGVTRVFALHHAGNHKAFGQLHGHVFERMHRQIRTPVFQRGLQFFDEQAFASNFAKGPVQNLIAFGGHAQQFAGMSQGTQAGLQMFGLPECQTALAGGDGEVSQSRNLFVIKRGMWAARDASMSG